MIRIGHEKRENTLKKDFLFFEKVIYILPDLKMV